MTELDVESFAREATEQVQPGGPPNEAIAGGQRPRTWVVVLGAAAAVALVIGLAVAPPWSRGGPTPSEPSKPALPAPPGMRWVGAGHVVLSVPALWAGSQYGCESDPRPSVVYDAGYWTTCQDTVLGRRRHPAALWVLPTRNARSGYGGVAFVKARHAAPRLHARRSDPWREGGDAGHYWYQSLVVPSARTLFVAQGATRAEVERLLGSARRTSTGVAVPPVAAGVGLAGALDLLDGYDVHVRRVAGDYRAGTVIGSDPAFGSPLRRGDSIVLTVSTGLGDRQAISNDVLARHGIRVEPLGTVSSSDRERLDRAREEILATLADHPSPWAGQLVLRRVTTTTYTRQGTPMLRHRLAWVLLTPRVLAGSLGGPCCGAAPPAALGSDISVYDALTGAFVWGTSY